MGIHSWHSPTRTCSASVSTRRLDQSANSPFSGNALEVSTLIAIFGLDLVWIELASHIVLLHNHAIEIDECLGNHVQPLVRQSLCFFNVSVFDQATPRQHLLRSPSKGIVPLSIGTVESNLTARGLCSRDQPSKTVKPGQCVEHQ